MRARHLSSTSRWPGWVVAAAVVVLVVALGGWLLGRGGDTDDTSQQVAPGSAQGSPTTSAPTTGSSPTDTASSAPSSATPGTDTAQQSALAACRKQLGTGDQFVVAEQSSYRDWKAHTRSRIDLDNGTLSRAQANRNWTTSKARGPKDMAGYAKASAAFSQVAGSCDDIPGVATAPVKACRARAQAQDDVLAVGKTIRDQWSAHLVMMAEMPQMAMTSYDKRWVDMVRDAQPTLRSFEQTLAALDDAPTCPA